MDSPASEEDGTHDCPLMLEHDLVAERAIVEILRQQAAPPALPSFRPARHLL